MRLASAWIPSAGYYTRTFVWHEGENVWLSAADLLQCKEYEVSSVLLLYRPEQAADLRKKLAAYSPGTSPDVQRVEAFKDNIHFEPVVSTPEKILCVGLNYSDHAREFGDPIPEEPVIFCKSPSALSAHRSNIVLPAVSDRVDFEGELVVVIGQTVRNATEENARQFIGGYCCGNDVSARDWQKGKPAGQWFLGKSFDTFAPVGPYFVTPDEIEDPNNLKIETRVNSEVMQSSNTSNFIFKIETLIAYLSSIMTLRTGDLIFTGTPNGVGDARKPPVYLKDGDEVSVEIENLGKLVNRAVAQRGRFDC